MYAEAKFWNKVARKYARDPIKNMDAYEAGLARVAARLSPSDTVLEIGCGTGTTALRLAEHTAHYTGADISSEMIAIANEKLAESKVDGLEFTVAPANETRFSSETYDAILGFNILHLVDGLEQSLSRAHDLLKPGGLFMTKTPCLGQMNFAIRLLIPVMQFFGKAPFVGIFNSKELETKITTAGFEIVESRAFEGAPNNWFVVARKI